MRQRRCGWLAAIILAGAPVAGLVAAAEMSVADAIAARRSNLKDLGGAFKAVRDQLKRPTPDVNQLKQASEEIAKLSADMEHWFPKGSGPESGEETKAKAEIWSDAQGFAKARDAFTREAPQLLQLANASDIAGMKAQAGKLGQACKGCHDKYRVPED
jgi:cytochrome c556